MNDEREIVIFNSTQARLANLFHKLHWIEGVGTHDIYNPITNGFLVTIQYYKANDLLSKIFTKLVIKTMRECDNDTAKKLYEWGYIEPA